MEDEPSYVRKKSLESRVGPQRIIDTRTRKFVKGIDPLHPFYLNHSPTNLANTPRKYNAGADIVTTDMYPVVPRGIRESYALARRGDTPTDCRKWADTRAPR